MAAVALVLLLLMIDLTYTSAQVKLIQPDSESTTPGRTVILNCTVQGISLSSSYVYWYQQRRDSAPRFVLRGTDTRGDGIPDRFTGREDESTNVGYLTISNVESKDAADYYSGIRMFVPTKYEFVLPWTSPELHSWNGFYTALYHRGWYFGSGTRLNVLGRQPASPTMSLLPPAKDQIAANAATLVCLVNNFYPDSVKLVWSVDGKVRDAGVQTSPTLQDSDQTFSVSSYLTLSASEWNSHELYSCGVKHEALGSKLEQSIRRSNCL